VQNSGGYSTGFTITQSVTIDAAGFNASVISTGSGDLCTIFAGATDRVVLRGISFHGARVGQSAIDALQMGSLYVEHCSIAEFKEDGVHAVVNGGNVWVTDTDVRACNIGLFVAGGSAPVNMVAQDSRLTECGAGVVLLTDSGSGAVTGSVSNCTASLCNSAGFAAVSFDAGNADLTLTNCRAVRNNLGISAETTSTGNATLRIANCVVTRNSTGISTMKPGSGSIAVIGTNAGTNVVDGDTTNGFTTGSTPMQ
jgi:hypothetical protein